MQYFQFKTQQSPQDNQHLLLWAQGDDFHPYTGKCTLWDVCNTPGEAESDRNLERALEACSNIQTREGRNLLIILHAYADLGVYSSWRLLMLCSPLLTPSTPICLPEPSNTSASYSLKEWSLLTLEVRISALFLTNQLCCELKIQFRCASLLKYLLR